MSSWQDFVMFEFTLPSQKEGKACRQELTVPSGTKQSRHMLGWDCRGNKQPSCSDKPHQREQFSPGLVQVLRVDKMSYCVTMCCILSF